jgi:hypothetical protein
VQCLITLIDVLADQFPFPVLFTGERRFVPIV